MQFSDLRAKLLHAIAMVESEADKRVIMAELTDIGAMLDQEEVKMSPFPIQCECHLRNDKAGKHKTCPTSVAQQAFYNYARYYGAGKQGLEDIRKRGGFGCVEIRLLLKGIDPSKTDWYAVKYDDGLNLFPPKMREFLVQNPTIKL